MCSETSVSTYMRVRQAARGAISLAWFEYVSPVLAGVVRLGLEYTFWPVVGACVLLPAFVVWQLVWSPVCWVGSALRHVGAVQRFHCRLAALYHRRVTVPCAWWVGL